MRISDWSSDVCSSDLSWLFVIQALLVLAIWQLGASNPTNDHLAPFALWAIVVAFLSATQAIVIDAYRIEILSDAELPPGTAMNQFGYRTGNLIISEESGVGKACGRPYSSGWTL